MMKTPDMNFTLRSSLVAAAIALGLFAAAPALHAQVETYTNETAFNNNLASGAYFESFSEFNGKAIPSPQTFSLGGFSYTLSDADTDISYSSTAATPANGTQQESVYPIVSDPGESFVITFTSGNVTAVGGDFFITNSDFSPLADDTVTVTLSTGQNVVLSSTGSYDTEPFAGFTSSTPILSLTISSPASTDVAADVEPYVTLDNLYVGTSTYAAPVSPTAPEPTTWALMLGGLGLLVGAHRATRIRA